MKKILFFFILSTTIFLIGCDSKKEIYNDFNEEFEQIKNEIDSSEQVVFDMNIEMDIWDDKTLVGNSDLKSNFKLNKNPLYVEADVRMGLENYQYVYEQVGKLIYQYELVDNAAITTYYGKVNEFENSKENGALGFKFDAENGIAEMEDDYYIFTQKYGDALSDEEISYLEDLYELLGVSLDDVLNSEFTTKFKFSDNGFYMSNNILITINMPNPNLPGHYKEFTIEAFIEYDFEIKEFNMIDLNDFEQVARNIEDVSHYSKLDTYYYYYMPEKYYKFNLKKGYYYFDTSKNNIHLSPDFYDDYNNLINIEYIVDADKNRIYYINNDGDYYVRVSGEMGGFTLKEYDINMRKALNLKYNEDIAFSLNQNQYASITINELDSILIENVGNNDLKLISTGLDREYIIPAKSKMCVYIGLGQKEVLFKNVGLNGEECKIKINKITSAGVDLSYDKLEEITSEPSKGYYVHGGYLTTPEMKLNVTESGFYTFKNSCDESSNFSYEVMYYNGGYIQFIENTKYYLAEGEYIIRLGNYDVYSFAYGNVYYEFEKHEVQTSYEIELEKTTKEPYESDYPTIPLKFTLGADSYKYYFTITENCVVETYNYIYLYNENDEIVTGSSQKSFNLEPGRYYFKSNFRGSSETENLKIAIKEQ